MATRTLRGLATTGAASGAGGEGKRDGASAIIAAMRCPTTGIAAINGRNGLASSAPASAQRKRLG